MTHNALSPSSPGSLGDPLVASGAEAMITHAELQRHSTPGDAWVALDGVVFDITRLAAEHTFGDVFRGLLGTDCAAIFTASHLSLDWERLFNSEAFRQRHGIHRIGRLEPFPSASENPDRAPAPYLERLAYRRTRDDLFWQELRQEAASCLSEWGESPHYSKREAAGLVLYHLAIYGLLSYLTWTYGSWLAASLLGAHMICALTNIAHMAAHHGFSRSRVIDLVAKHFFDLAGLSGLEWQVAHLTHHHQPHSTLDYQTNAYRYLGIRIHAGAPRHAWHRFQAYYFWLVIAAYFPFRFVSTSIWVLRNQPFRHSRWDVWAHFVAKATLVVQIAGCYLLHGPSIASAVLLAYSTAFSLTAFVLLFNNHAETHEPLGASYDLAPLQGRLSWAETQVRTSGNWRPTNVLLAFVEFHYGYFNCHIEHHLFPTLKPRLLKRLAPVVQAVCERHHLPYRSTSFWEVQRSLVGHLVRMGDEPLVAS